MRLGMVETIELLVFGFAFGSVLLFPALLIASIWR
jgi:hypothetical protein